jgi:glycosyltransferase involved in cell wall biosynthesis
MKVLMVHDYYRIRAGEEACFDREVALLERHGDEVVAYTRDNASIEGMGRLALAARTVWSRQDYRALRRAIRVFQPDVVHVQNFFPLISPAAHWASKAERAPVVQTLHNYRLLCPAGVLLREGRVCEDCLHWAVPWPGVLHGCYPQGRAATATAAAMLAAHRLLGTWRRACDVYIAQTEFMRRKFAECGLPEKRIALKPIFVEPDLGAGAGAGGYALFVGRLSREKGLGVLLAAWQRLGGRVPLKIVGRGPLEEEVAAAAGRLPEIEALGHVPRARLVALMQEARVLVFPSIWYEGFPAVLGEAFSTGLPVIASRLGSMETIVEHGRTGLHFAPGDAQDLAAKVEWAWTHPRELAQMRRAARAEFEVKYTAERNYRMLIEIYERAIAARSAQ